MALVAVAVIFVFERIETVAEITNFALFVTFLLVNGAVTWDLGTSQNVTRIEGIRLADRTVNIRYGDRPLGPEFGLILGAGYLRGADLWHLSCALYLAGNPRDLPFITLDERQEVVARKLGFPG